MDDGVDDGQEPTCTALEGEQRKPHVQGLGFRVLGLGFRVQGSGFRVQGSGFRFRVEGLGFRV